MKRHAARADLAGCLLAVAGCAAGSAPPAPPAPPPAAAVEQDDAAAPVPVPPALQAGPAATAARLDAGVLGDAPGRAAFGGPVLATVGERELRPADVLAPLFLTHTQLVFAALEEAVRRELLTREAARLEVTAGEDVVAAALARALKAQEDEFRLAMGPAADLQRYIEERYGTSAEVYRRAVREKVLEDVFLARLVRYEARLHERMEVRILVVDDVETAREILEKLEEGANFAALAKAHSVDRSAARGGLFPPVALDCPHPLLAQAADLAPGERAEIATVERGPVRLYRVLEVERRIPADPRPFAEQADAIEADLEARPLDPFEVLEWDRRMRERYPIEVRLGRA